MRTKSLSEPVVFVHGYLDFWHAPWWSKIERYMGKIGFDTTKLRRVNLGDVPGTTVGSPRRYAEKVREEVERAYDDHGEVSIIAHSMGGIDS
ncbi:MAG: hypothetical protein SV760_10415, partial [Halobacteria archaeon]|nr:hypothetical protein [Halobacteria archaeon]